MVELRATRTVVVEVSQPFAGCPSQLSKPARQVSYAQESVSAPPLHALATTFFGSHAAQEGAPQPVVG